MLKTMFGFMLHYPLTEKAVVNGMTGFADLTKFAMKHQTFWTLEDMKLFSALMNASPIRLGLAQDATSVVSLYT